jgi:hypothetical protein
LSTTQTPESVSMAVPGKVRVVTGGRAVCRGCMTKPLPSSVLTSLEKIAHCIMQDMGWSDPS